MKHWIGLIALALILTGCSSEPQVTETTTQNASGELEGNEPKFIMVPAQGDPNNPNRK
jgi:PBP1b-binding outer membrane lipoprotein LpoB